MRPLLYTVSIVSSKQETSHLKSTQKGYTNIQTFFTTTMADKEENKSEPPPSNKEGTEDSNVSNETQDSEPSDVAATHDYNTRSKTAATHDEASKSEVTKNQGEPKIPEENAENEDKYKTSKPSSAVSVTEENSGVVGAEEIKSINDRDEAAKEEQQKAGAETKPADDQNTNETSKEESQQDDDKKNKKNGCFPCCGKEEE